MMAAQPFPAQQLGIGVPHPGMPHAPHMGPGQHPGMGAPGPQMMHHGGAQVSQGGPMVTGMPPGAPTPAPGSMPNQHAMQHFAGPQQQMFQQPHPGMQQMNPMMQQQQQHLLRRQQMLQQQMQGQHGHGVPVTMPNGAQNMNPQFLAMQRQMQQGQPGMQFQMHGPGGANQQHVGNPQQVQMIAHHQALAQAAQQQQQQALAQQAAQARNNQMMQEPNASTQPPQPQPTPAPQAAPPPTPQPQSSQPPPTGPPQPQVQQQPQPSQSQQQQAHQQPQQQPTAPPQQQPQTSQPQQQQQGQPGQQPRDPQQVAQAAQMQQQKNAALMMQQRQAQAAQQQAQASMKGASILRVIQFCDHLSTHSEPEKCMQLGTWQDFVSQFFAPEGYLRTQLWNSRDSGDKRFQVSVPALPRYYWNHFMSGVKHINMHLEKARETPLATGGYTVEGRTTTTWVYDKDIRVVAYGALKAHLDTSTNIEILDLSIKKHVEYIPRGVAEISVASPEQKQSPELTKKKKSQQKQVAPPPTAIALPASPVTKDWGVTQGVLGFLETAETMTQMAMLFAFCTDHPDLRPQDALDQLVRDFPTPQTIAMNPRFNPAMQQMPAGQRTPGLNGPNAFNSPAMQHLGLPQQGSPHVGAGHTPSPHQTHMPGPVAMAHQQSQQGSNLSGSQGTSANTSPNVTNKKRRASAVKLESEEIAEVNGVGGHKVKPSPRIGGKRQKGQG